MQDIVSSKDALLTEHFRYTPLSLIDDIINTVNAIIYHALEAIESGLLATPPSVLGFGAARQRAQQASAATQRLGDIADTDGDGNVLENHDDADAARAEIENGVHQLETLLEATVDKTFDRFEIYTLRNILTVPDELLAHVRLGHYENLSIPLPASAPTLESIAAQRLQLRESQRRTIALQAEQAQNAALLDQLRSLLGASAPSSVQSPKQESSPPSKTAAGDAAAAAAANAPFSFLLSPASPPSKTASLAPKARFLASQLPALRALVDELRPKVRSLPETIEGMDWNTDAEERRGYVDAVVDRVVGDEGVEEPDGREHRGRVRTVEEVRALEGVFGQRGH